MATLELSNALGSIATPRTGVGNSAHINEITLTADPFTDASSYNFTLNDTAGGGALCRAAGSRAFRDIGALQHEDAGGGGSLPRARMGC